MLYAKGQFVTLSRERVVVEIHTKAETQEVKELVLGANPLVITCDNVDWVVSPVCNSRASLAVFLRDSSMIQHLTSQELNTVRLLVKVNGVAKWGGFFDAEGVEFPEDNNNGHIVTLNFGDFAPLKLRRYTPEGILSLSSIISKTVAVLGVPVRTTLAHLPDSPSKTYINTNVLGETSTLYDLLCLVGYATCSTVRQWGAIEWVNPLRAREKQRPVHASKLFRGDGSSYVSKIHNTVNYELETAKASDLSAGVYRIESNALFNDMVIEDKNVGKYRFVSVSDRDHNFKALRGQVLEWENKTNVEDEDAEPERGWAVSLFRRRDYNGPRKEGDGHNQHDRLPVIEVVSDPLVFDGRDVHIEVECALRTPYVGDMLSDTKVLEFAKTTATATAEDRKKRSGIPLWRLSADLLILDVEGNILAYYVDRLEKRKLSGSQSHRYYQVRVKEWREVAPGGYTPSGETASGTWVEPPFFLEYVNELGYNEEFNVNSDPHIKRKRTRGVDIPLPTITGAHRVQLNIWAREKVTIDFPNRTGDYIGAVGYKAIKQEDEEVNRGDLPEWRRRLRLIRKVTISQKGGEGRFKVTAFLNDEVTEGIDYRTPLGTNESSKAYIYRKTEDGGFAPVLRLSKRPHEHVIIQSLYALYASRGVAYNVTIDKAPESLLYEITGSNLILTGYEYRVKQNRCDMNLQPINADTYGGEEI